MKENNSFAPKSKKNHNRRMGFGRRIAVGATGVLALAASGACAEKSEAPRVTFTSYAEAKTKLTNLSNKHGNSTMTSKAEDREMTTTLEGALPAFKEHVAMTLSQLVDKSSGEYQVASEGNTNFIRITSTVNDEGLRIDQVTSSTLNEKNESKARASLSVTYKKDGQVEINFEDDNKLRSYYSGGHVIVDGKTIETFDMYDGDNDLQTRHDQNGNLTEFNGSFGPWTYDGLELKHTVNGMQEIEEFLTIAHSAAQA